VEHKERLVQQVHQELMGVSEHKERRVQQVLRDQADRYSNGLEDGQGVEDIAQPLMERET
jgi:hypothetical protein